jgi:hypothetical protein
MFYQTEDKAQGWRAMVTFRDGRSEALLLLGQSSTRIRGGYIAAFNEVLDEEERSQAETISLQQWEGAADAGRWKHKTSLKVPTDKLAVTSAA